MVYFLLALAATWWAIPKWHSEAFKVAKIIAKTEYCKHPKSYYLELQHLIHFDYNYLLKASYINLPNAMCKRQPYIAACFMCPVTGHFVSFFQFRNEVPKCPKTWQVYEQQLGESFENLLFHQFSVFSF